MADEKTFSESEHIAILADRVRTETADLTAERDQLVDEKTELENKLDVEATAKTAAEQRAADAEKALEDYKAEVDAEREAAAKKDERVAKVREVAGHLADDFFEDAKRLNRIVAMNDEIFEGYLADLGAASKTAPKTTTSVPRETAMAGAGANSSASAGQNFLLRRYIAPEEG